MPHDPHFHDCPLDSLRPIWLDLRALEADKSCRRGPHAQAANVRNGKKKIPVVICPSCDEPMKAIERKPVDSERLVDVTYVCETCHTHTIRTIKPDGKGLL